MLYSEEQARANVRSREGQRVFFLGAEDCLTSAARDYLTRERIRILPAREAAAEEYPLAGGGFIREKPEHMTHLEGLTLALKTHPRIRFRGKLDSLQGWLVLCAGEIPALSRELEEILAFSRQLMRREVMGEPVAEETLLGLDEGQLRHASHFPQEYLGQPHFMPGAAHGREIGLMNLARCAAREAEVACVAAFTDEDGQMTRPDLIRAMNRLSSAIYLLMIRWQANRKEGNA